MTAGGFAGRAVTIDREQTRALHYLGNYVRRMPTNLKRMMENAYDWEHLPFVHPQAFASIAIAEEGRWGWRAEVTLPDASGGGKQLIELLVDPEQSYWATTVVEGLGQGTQIHTQARDVSAEEGAQTIEVDVRFYLPQAPETDEQSAVILGYLQTQYAGLYDQDEALMVARQDALDNDRRLRAASGPERASLGPEAKLDRSAQHSVTLGDTVYSVRFHDAGWIAHAAVCPHLLGPLGNAPISGGAITCPWHGYRFPVDGGREVSGHACTLPSAAITSIEQGELIVHAP